MICDAVNRLHELSPGLAEEYAVRNTKLRPVFRQAVTSLVNPLTTSRGVPRSGQNEMQVESPLFCTCSEWVVLAGQKAGTRFRNKGEQAG